MGMTKVHRGHDANYVKTKVRAWESRGAKVPGAPIPVSRNQRNAVLDQAIERLGNENRVPSERHIKNLARYLSRRDGISHNRCLDSLAQRLGYPSWSAKQGASQG
jgi:hypothetical protein